MLARYSRGTNHIWKEMMEQNLYKLKKIKKLCLPWYFVNEMDYSEFMYDSGTDFSYNFDRSRVFVIDSCPIFGMRCPTEQTM
jgi:hypothetical protein